MATAKITSLVIRTLAKPISNQIKAQAKQHERFRSICIGLAQRMYQTEVRLRTNLLGEPAKHVRPLSETRAIENGANSLAEGFLFAVAAGLILGEQYRSSRNQSKRRDTVDDQLDELKSSLDGLNTRLDALARQQEERLTEESMRYVLHLPHDELARILQRVVEIGLREASSCIFSFGVFERCTRYPISERSFISVTEPPPHYLDMNSKAIISTHPRRDFLACWSAVSGVF